MDITLKKSGDYLYAFNGEANEVALVLGLVKFMSRGNVATAIPYYKLEEAKSTLESAGNTVSVHIPTPKGARTDD